MNSLIRLDPSQRHWIWEHEMMGKRDQKWARVWARYSHPHTVHVPVPTTFISVVYLWPDFPQEMDLG